MSLRRKVLMGVDENEKTLMMSKVNKRTGSRKPKIGLSSFKFWNIWITRKQDKRVLDVVSERKKLRIEHTDAYSYFMSPSS